MYKGNEERKIEDTQLIQSVANIRDCSLLSSNWPCQSLMENTQAASRSEAVKLFNYEYTIPDLNLLPQKIGEYTSSPIFYANSHKQIQWKLIFFPNGNREEDKGYFNFYLKRVVQPQEKLSSTNVSLKVVLFQNGEKLFSKATHWDYFTSKSKSWGWHKFVSLSQLRVKDSNQENELKMVISLFYEAEGSKTACIVI